MQSIGLSVPSSGFAHILDDAMTVADEVGYPVIVRPSYILGGAGTGIAADPETFEILAAQGLEASPISEILIERSIAGWKEYELEVMRDNTDNCVVVCSIENLDPMGVHTGDSITVAPIQTLTDVEYQQMRDDAFACIRRIGVETGGSNIQFAVNPESGDTVVIEMNPRVSRSSALASKATGFPIAKIAAKLAVGYTLDEIRNDITGETPASFEPTIDYVVTKVPRWAFEKFPSVPDVLGTRMQSVGEAMGIGRTFCESVQKALRSLEQGRYGLNADPVEMLFDATDDEALLRRAAIATPDRLFQLEALLRRGISVERLHEATGVDPWFLTQLQRITQERLRVETMSVAQMTRADWKRVKRLGFADAQLSYLWKTSEVEVRAARKLAKVEVTFKAVDTCGAEFAARTPYHYSTYEEEDEVRVSTKPTIVILGSGPNRIGQGIEFDYCCVHASFALREAGFDTVMINCNPETVSTDYDISTRLYVEPITEEHVTDIIEREQPVGVIVGLGGETPLKLADKIPAHLLMGTSAASIDLAEDRKQWSALCSSLGIQQPAGGTAVSVPEAQAIAGKVHYPVLIRPSYVLGGRAMQIVYDDDELSAAMAELAGAGSLGREGGLSAERPVLVDRFLDDAVEVDVDAIRDSTGEVLIGGVMEHIEAAGVHSGDSTCVLPPPTLTSAAVATITEQTIAIAKALDVVGPVNVQFVVKVSDVRYETQVYVIEANPRASRTLPFVAKATGVPLAKIAARVMAGASLAELRAQRLVRPPSLGGHVSVKAPVLPFDRFADVDTILGPEMRSTGEVMGIDATFGLAFIKSQMAAGNRLPTEGAVFLSLADRDKPLGLAAARRFVELGFTIAATEGTAKLCEAAGLPIETIVVKLGEDAPRDESLPDAIQLISSGKVCLVINTPRGRGSQSDGAYIRKAAKLHKVPCLTTMAAGLAAAAGIADALAHPQSVRCLQEFHAVDQQALPL